jgi:hypothetical protein
MFRTELYEFVDLENIIYNVSDLYHNHALIQQKAFIKFIKILTNILNQKS